MANSTLVAQWLALYGALDVLLSSILLMESHSFRLHLVGVALLVSGLYFAWASFRVSQLGPLPLLFGQGLAAFNMLLIPAGWLLGSATGELDMFLVLLGGPFLLGACYLFRELGRRLRRYS